LVAATRTRAVTRTSRRLIQRFPEIEAVAASAELEREHRRREQLLHDLVRLAAATAAHRRELRYLGPPFDVRPELDAEERRLTLVGTRTPSEVGGNRSEVRSRVAAAIRAGRLEEIVWDNSPVETYLTWPSVPVSSLQIGYHVVNGAHSFTALTELARREPDRVISALEPLFLPRPDSPVHELDRLSAAALRVLLQPRSTGRLGGATLRAVLRSKEVRRLLRAYLASPEARAEAAVDLVLKDLVRLWLVGQSPTDLELDAGNRKLVYRTNAGASRNGTDLDAAAVRSLERIVWDNSAEGPIVTSTERPHLSVRLDGGVYEFEGLTLVARHFPELAAPVLRWAAADE
jgi:hypothetical protein